MRSGTHAALTGLLVVAVICAAALWFRLLPVRATEAEGQTALPAYVSSSECASCHDEIADSYAQVGMAHSLYPAAKDLIGNGLQSEVVFYHPASRTWFSMERRDGELYQSRWQQGDKGEKINLDSKKVDYVMGSGNHVRTYLHRNTDGTLTELPLAWYAENSGTWAMNPGFDNPTPPTRHTISYGCMFCHDGYPQVPRDLGDSVAHPVYLGDLPQGIDCQRCHGPGSAHVQAARIPGAPPEQVRSKILNPARLDNERQMEICMQCHLEVTSFHLPDRIRRYDQQPFGYTPDMPLTSFFQYFQRDFKGKPDPLFDIDSAPYRLRQSKCFLNSNGALTCERCHDPHQPHQTADAEWRYVAACLSCHASRLSSLISANKHTSQSDCIGCHMPKRRTDDVVHVVMTDHLIQRFAGPAVARLDPKKEFTETTANSYRGEVKPYRVGAFASPDDDLYTATAQVLHDSNSVNGIARLTKLIAERHPSQPEFSIELGDALHRAGQLSRAIDAYRDAVRIDPHSLRARRSLGAALAESGDMDKALKELGTALQDYPGESLLWYEIGRIHARQKHLAQAIVELTKATELDPELAEAYNELGIVLAEGAAAAAAEAAFRNSLRIAPYDPGVASNLQMLNASRGGSAK
jgi:Flp pilus assembly protein TadD